MATLGGFGALDWCVVAGFLVLTTVLGKRLAGPQTGLRDFFLGGRSLPWWAVAGSIVATEVSAVTFLSLPYVIFRDDGNLTYLQLGVLALLLAKLAVALFLVPRYFEQEIYSPYDFVGERLGAPAKRVATVLFSIGGVLAQSARVFLTAVVLELMLVDELRWIEELTGIPPLAAAVTAIGIVSVGWTWAGGMAAVIWTDAILFLVFLIGIAIAFFTATAGLEGGAGEVFEVAQAADKLRVFDLSVDPTRAYTLWAALFAYVIWGVGMFGTDQLLTQRLFCCRDARDARRALVASNVALFVTVLAAFVGLALYAYYQAHPLAGDALAEYEGNGDRIFPIFILSTIPAGWKGLVIAGVFAAAISSLDSILAALSQATLSTVVPGHRRSVATSRMLVVIYGVVLCMLAVLMEGIKARFPSILDLSLAMAGYTVGALLGGVLLAMAPLGRNGRGYVWSAPLAVVVIAIISETTSLAYPWFAPIGLAVAYIGGWLLSGYTGVDLRQDATMRK